MAIVISKMAQIGRFKPYKGECSNHAVERVPT